MNDMLKKHVFYQDFGFSMSFVLASLEWIFLNQLDNVSFLDMCDFASCIQGPLL